MVLAVRPWPPRIEERSSPAERDRRHNRVTGSSRRRPRDGTRSLGHKVAVERKPASNMKVLTAAAALSFWGLNIRFTDCGTSRAKTSKARLARRRRPHTTEPDIDNWVRGLVDRGIRKALGASRRSARRSAPAAFDQQPNEQAAFRGHRRGLGGPELVHLARQPRRRARLAGQGRPAWPGLLRTIEHSTGESTRHRTWSPTKGQRRGDRCAPPPRRRAHRDLGPQVPKAHREPAGPCGSSIVDALQRHGLAGKSRHASD